MAESIIMSIFPFVALSVGPTTIEILHFQFVAGCFISPFAIVLTLFFILFICILFYFNVFLFYFFQRCVLITFFSSQLPVRWLNYSSFGFTTRTLQQFVAFSTFFTNPQVHTTNSIKNMYLYYFCTNYIICKKIYEDYKKLSRKYNKTELELNQS